MDQPVALKVLLQKVKDMGLSTMVYSGYTLEQIQQNKHKNSVLAHVDLLVDGPFIESQRTTKRRFIGSANQNLHFLTSRYQKEDRCFQKPNQFEIHFKNGELSLSGFPLIKPFLDPV